jgi:hypothetical protein
MTRRAYVDRCIHLGAWGVVLGDVLAVVIYRRHIRHSFRKA